MEEKELEGAVEAVKDSLDLHLPLWGRLLVFGVKFLPIPGWLKSLLPVAIGLIAKLPKQAKDEVSEAARESIRQSHAKPLVQTFKKHCSGVACPPDLLSDPFQGRG